MKTQPSFKALHDKHESLWNKYLNNRADILSDKKKCEALGEEIKALISEIQTALPTIRSSDDFSNLSDALAKWQLVLWSSLGIPFDIEIPIPKQSLAQRPVLKPKLSESDVDQWITNKAYYLSKDRKEAFLEALRDSPEALHMIVTEPHRALELLVGVSEDNESKNDFRNANIHFAKAVLDGSIDLAQELGPESYHHLEEQWLEEVKQLDAYYIWEKNRIQGRASNAVSDYNEACENLWNRLLDETIKSPQNLAKEIREYIQSQYLNPEGRIEEKKCEPLVLRKLERLSGGNPNAVSESARKDVNDYVRDFYENIIPAIDGDIDGIKKALFTIEPQHDSFNYRIATCLEMAIPIYFIDVETITKALRR